MRCTLWRNEPVMAAGMGGMKSQQGATIPRTHEQHQKEARAGLGWEGPKCKQSTASRDLPAIILVMSLLSSGWWMMALGSWR